MIVSPRSNAASASAGGSSPASVSSGIEGHRHGGGDFGVVNAQVHIGPIDLFLVAIHVGAFHRCGSGPGRGRSLKLLQ